MADSAPLLLSISNTVVALHKQQFGRGPTRARSEWVGRDSLLVALEDALLPAEIAMVEMGEAHRVTEQRVFLQRATASQFIEAVERLVERKVKAFTSAINPEHRTVYEVFVFEPE